MTLIALQLSYIFFFRPSHNLYLPDYKINRLLLLQKTHAIFITAMAMHTDTSLGVDRLDYEKRNLQYKLEWLDRFCAENSKSSLSTLFEC